MPNNTNGKFKAAILGASGYTGAELVRILSDHKVIDIFSLAGDKKAGLKYSEVFPHLRHLSLPNLITINQLDFSQVDIVFSALPHATSANVIRKIPHNLKIIDLSADFRLSDLSQYEYWYGTKHSYPEGMGRAVYGLTEFYREEIKHAGIVACTGCNAATALYPLLPLLKNNVVKLSNIIIDIKTGISGAGRTLRENLLHSESSEGVSPYGVLGHRHIGELRQELSKVAGSDVDVTFIPHLLPQNRGILGSIYVNGSSDEIYNVLSRHYRDEFFISVLPFGEVPSTKHVRGSNFVHIGVADGTKKDQTIVFCALDNLVKGSAGQAVQNANLVLNLEEQHSLQSSPIFP